MSPKVGDKYNTFAGVVTVLEVAPPQTGIMSMQGPGVWVKVERNGFTVKVRVDSLGTRAE